MIARRPMANDREIPYLTPNDAVAYLRLRRRTLANMGHRRNGPDYRKHGGRIVYDINDLDAWSNATRRRSGHDVPRPKAPAAEDYGDIEYDGGDACDPNNDAGLETTVRPISLLAQRDVAVLVTAPCATSHLIVNVTPSIPVGLYCIEHRAHAWSDFVHNALTHKYRNIGVARGYLRQDRHLLKSIAAMDTDQLSRRGSAVWINGHIRV
jgi:hypothetical protein